jgi:hypothetical protein
MLPFIDGQAIAEWAARIGASHQLPRLIRRLIWATLNRHEIKRISFPAGADVLLPGFDGQLETTVSSQWIPEGPSVWELSVEGHSNNKARKDYIKRRDGLDANGRAQLAYVAVSARRWKDQIKQDWVDSRKEDGERKCTC